MLLALLVVRVAKPYDPADLAPTTVCHVNGKTQLLCLHNYTRKHQGLVTLKGATPLYQAAAAKTARIAQCDNVFTHNPCGEDAFEFFPAEFPPTGENAAYGYQTIRLTYIAWLNSPGHYANIVNPFARCFGSSRTLNPALPFLWITDFASAGC